MAENSDYESDNFEDCPTDAAAENLLKRVPKFCRKTNSRKKISELRSLLPKHNPEANKKKSPRIETNKQVDGVLKDLKTDLSNLMSKFDKLYTLFPCFVDTLEIMEERVTSLESELRGFLTKFENSKSMSSDATTYRDALTSNDSQRLTKLEYANSEEERKKRHLEICITHLSIETSSSNVSEQLKSVFRDVLKLENREIDSSFRVRKSKRENTVIATFSHVRFKHFVYRARKQLRTDGDAPNFYLNGNLTSYNYNILMKLKKNRKDITNTSDSDPYASIYSFEGKIFVKLKNEQNGNHIKDLNQLEKHVEEMKQATPPTSQAPTTSASAQANNGC